MVDPLESLVSMGIGAGDRMTNVGEYQLSSKLHNFYKPEDTWGIFFAAILGDLNE